MTNQTDFWEKPAFPQTLTEHAKHSFDVTARFHRGADTSVESNPPNSVKLAQQKRILEALMRAKEASCERLEVVTGISHQSCSARISELLRDGRIKIVGRSTTISGKPCRLYSCV